ncbi:MAG: nitroreductase family protein [Verrucomicrobiia bacterium]
MKIRLFCYWPVLAFPLMAWSQPGNPPAIPLPPADTGGGMPLMQALRERKTQREFRPDALSPELLSNLLWAAFGVNRPEDGHRTAPSAMNAQEIDLYVATKDGLYLYDAPANRLQPVLKSDLRGKTSGQDFATQAPVTLIFVADYARMQSGRPEQKELYSTFDAGCISQNIYLFCASAGLATVVHELDRRPLVEAMKLRPDQRIVFAQAVGFPR